jgi:hypothetical protein
LAHDSPPTPGITLGVEDVYGPDSAGPMEYIEPKGSCELFFLKAPDSR